MKIGIIGGGAIANFLLEKAQKTSNLHIESVYIRNEEKYAHLKQQYQVELFTDMDDFLRSDIDIVVEAANVKAVKQLLPKVVKKKEVIVISIGAFADENFVSDVVSIAEKSNKRIHLPSGAIGGLDLLQNAHALEEVTDVSLTTTKPAHSLTDEPLTSSKIIFKGPAKEAIKRFPKNINVSIILSLAGIGTNETKVKIIADPQATKNEHMIEIKGAFGTASVIVANSPMENNPNTSYLAALSVLSTLKKQAQRIQIG